MHSIFGPELDAALQVIKRCASRFGYSSTVKQGVSTDDICQEVLLRLWNHPPHADVPWTGYASRITRNYCIDLARRQRPTVPICESTHACTPTIEERICSEEALRELPANESELLYRQYILGETVKELAERTGVCDNTVKTRIRRAKMHAMELFPSSS